MKKPFNDTPREKQIATLVSRAKACLVQLMPLVLDTAADVAQACADVAGMPGPQAMEELACWKKMRHDVPEWHSVLAQHGF